MRPSYILTMVLFVKLVRGDPGLAELPLEKLVHLKQALKGEKESSSPLKKTPLRRDDWESEHLAWKTGKGKGDIESIFQTTVTVLAFLAFGGYLVCLVVQGVKGTSLVVSTTTAAPLIAGRRRRSEPSPLFELAQAYAKYEALNAPLNSQEMND